MRRGSANVRSKLRAITKRSPPERQKRNGRFDAGVRCHEPSETVAGIRVAT